MWDAGGLGTDGESLRGKTMTYSCSSPQHREEMGDLLFDFPGIRDGAGDFFADEFLAAASHAEGGRRNCADTEAKARSDFGVRYAGGDGVAERFFSCGSG